MFRRSFPLSIVLAGLLFLSACAPMVRSGDRLPHMVGKKISVEGRATATELGGPTVVFDGFFVIVDVPPNFAGYVGKKVRVTGVLTAVPDPLSPAQTAYYLRDTEWKLLRW